MTTNCSMTCGDCGGDGWGPMLCNAVWSRLGPITPTPWVHVDQPNLPRSGEFLCEPCMEERLGRPLNGDDLRDCPMNYRHSAYKRHGRS